MLSDWCVSAFADNLGAYHLRFTADQHLVLVVGNLLTPRGVPKCQRSPGTSHTYRSTCSTQASTLKVAGHAAWHAIYGL